MNKLNRAVAAGIFFLVVTFAVSSLRADSRHLKTRTVVLIVSDGLRWQEIFTGADPL